MDLFVEIFVYICLFVLGVSFGSFGSVLLWRLRGKLDKEKINGILYGRSACPNCHATLTSLDLIPIFSWIFSRGKCRHCKNPVPAFYPILEIFSGIAFMFSFYFVKGYLGVVDFQSAYFLQNLLFMIVVNWFLVMFIMGDHLFYELNQIIWTIFVLFVILMQFLGFVGDFPTAFYGAMMFFGIFGFIYLFGMFYVKLRFGHSWTEGFGAGDVMVAFALGLMLPFLQGYNNIASTDYFYLLMVYVVLTSLLGIVFSIIALVVKKGEQGQSIPFLPAMVYGFWILLFFGKFILNFLSSLDLF